MPDPTEITEVERPVRSQQPQLQREIWHVMHRSARAVREAREQTAQREAEARGRLGAVLIDLARAHHQLRVFLDRSGTALAGAGLADEAARLATIGGCYAQVLGRAGVELVYHDGEPFTLELAGSVKVTGAVPSAGVTQPTVRETVNPGVLLHSQLISPPEVELAVPVRANGEPTTAGPSPNEAVDERGGSGTA